MSAESSSSSSSSSEKHEDSGEDTAGGEASGPDLGTQRRCAVLGATPDASLPFPFPVLTMTEDTAALGCCSWCGCVLGVLVGRGALVA